MGQYVVRTLQRFVGAIELNENLISTVIGGLVLVLVTSLFVSFFSSNDQVSSVFQRGEALQGATDIQEEVVGESIASQVKAHEVGVGESLWSIAEAEYGDGFAWTQIAKANDLSEPGVIRPGEVLDIPVVADEVQDSVTPETYTVQSGDSLWDIAETQLGDGFAWVQVFEMNKGVLVNPDVILAGTVLVLPGG